MSAVKETLALSEVPVGQKIWADVTIPAGDLIRPGGKTSTTMKKIFAGKPVRKQMIVLQNHGDHLVCVYTSTFGGSTVLPEMVREPKNWYPVFPATGAYVALPPEDENKLEPVWICMSTTFKITQPEVHVLSTRYAQQSVEVVKDAVQLSDPPMQGKHGY